MRTTTTTTTTVVSTTTTLVPTFFQALVPLLIQLSASSSTESDDTFVRSKTVPYNLRHFQPKERTLRQGVTKLLQKEFDETNQKLINLVRSN